MLPLPYFTFKTKYVLLELKERGRDAYRHSFLLYDINLTIISSLIIYFFKASYFDIVGNIPSLGFEFCIVL